MKLLFKILILLFICRFANADVKLPRLISDGMILQRTVKIKIWGWADPSENVTVEFRGKKTSATTSFYGQWTITLPSMTAGGPFEMIITGKNQVKISDIYVGDVWLASGQSNMELTMKQAESLYGKEITESENKSIRYFKVANRYNFKSRQEDLESGSWVSINPTTILNCSAVGYFFARELNKKCDVPIGLIIASLGGSPVEAWLSEEALKEFPSLLAEGKKYKSDAFINEIQDKDQQLRTEWYKTLRKSDKGYENIPWYNPTISADGWMTMKIPGYWADGPVGMMNGVMWFRKEFDVPATMVGKSAKFLMGRITDSDSTYVNGVLVGRTSSQYPPRNYEIPSTLLKEGKNIVTVRVISTAGRGGFVLDKPYSISMGTETIDLKGDWQYKVGTSMDPIPSSTAVIMKPMGLFNGEIAPLTNFTIRGVLWYQGESNTRNPKEYAETFPALIKDWRRQWGLGDFPFLYVQLANFMEAKAEPSESQWAELRDVQRRTLSSVRNTGMAVTIDIGEWNDIHPLNKRDVGMRLALLAEKISYFLDVQPSGPLYKYMTIEESKIYIFFSDLRSPLISKVGTLTGFSIAGVDRKFVWAEAKIEDDHVVVWNNSVPKPMYVRYGWADNPQINLYNKDWLPASPFTTEK